MPRVRTSRTYIIYTGAEMLSRREMTSGMRKKIGCKYASV